MNNSADFPVQKWEFVDRVQAAIPAPWFGKINDRNVFFPGALSDRQAKLFRPSRNIMMVHSRLTVAPIKEIRGECCGWHVSVGSPCEGFLCGCMPARSQMGWACHVFDCTLDIYTLAEESQDIMIWHASKPAPRSEVAPPRTPSVSLWV
jgi:hypothetical protein